jgi:DNA helicase-2/ATP-dependent DNA helicase PcrA
VKYVLKSSAPQRHAFDLTKELNPQQIAVVEAPPRELLVLAGAGTGKTRTLTYRVARLVAAGCPPERILLCTFTNRAAREMVARVEALLGIDMRRCSAGTFHHIGNRILRRHGQAVGLGPDFGILDPEDSRTLLASVIAELGVEALTARRFPTPKVLSSLIGLASGTRQPLGAVVEQHNLKLLDQAGMMERSPALRRAQAPDERLRLRRPARHWLKILEDPELPASPTSCAPATTTCWSTSTRTSTPCRAPCATHGREHRSLTCVGDDAQSIYSFRGADFNQIGAFRVRHPQAEIYKLTINYRSTPEILALANRSIAHNRNQYPKELTAVKQPGARPAVIPLRDVFQQAEFVAQRVLELHHEYDMPLSRMAVLYRNHSHSLELQVELTRRQIPFTVRSGLRFFEQAHIKDVVAYLRARQNPQDALSWVRLLRLWPGIGAQTAEQLATVLAGGEQSSAQRPPPRRAGRLGRGRTRDALARLGELWAILEDPALANPGDMIRRVVERTTASTPTATSPTPPPARRTSSSSPATPNATPPPANSSASSRSSRASAPRTCSAPRSPTTCSSCPPSTRPRASSGPSASCCGSPRAASRWPPPCASPPTSRRSAACSTSPSRAPATSSTCPTPSSRRPATAPRTCSAPASS